jgi:putative membrane protein
MGGPALRWLTNALALAAAVWLVPGIHFDGGPVRLALVAAVFGVVNALLRPLLTVLTCPLLVVTLGLFALVINALLLLATAWLSAHWGLGFRIDGFWPAFWGGILIGLVSAVVSLFIRERDSG